ncbi:MAG: hypothetical protein JRI75_01570 [Deltaproteobacteria bacterium]|nr:hypothetical protein [Deltaproteobacteria bacterium]
MEENAVQPEKKSGTKKFLAIGCLTIIVLAGVGGYFAYRGIKGKIAELVRAYTDVEPLELPAPTVTQGEAERLIAWVDDFKEKVKQGDPASPLVLTGTQINQLIHFHPDLAGLAGRVHVSIEGDKIRGRISIPIDEFAGIEGRYLNGTAVITAQLTSGRLMVFVDSVDVKDAPLPEEFMKVIRSENLAKKFNSDETLSAVIQKLESVTVEDGQMIIVPK